MERRDLLKTAPLALAGIGLLPIRPADAGPINSTIDALRETRFAIAFRRALARLRRRGTITPAEERRYWLAAVTAEPFDYKGNRGLFAEHLQHACEEVARASGDFREDLVDWWNTIVAWIIDNWKTVLGIILSLLVLLETPVAE